MVSKKWVMDYKGYEIFRCRKDDDIFYHVEGLGYYDNLLASKNAIDRYTKTK